MKLAIVGSRSFTDSALMEKVLKKYIERFGKIIVVSGGAEGADSLGKKLALQEGLDYIEYPPVHKPHNQYCVLPPENYGKSYNVANFFERNGLIVESADHVVAFVVEGVKASGTMDTVSKAHKMGKPVTIFTQH